MNRYFHLPCEVGDYLPVNATGYIKKHFGLIFYPLPLTPLFLSSVHSFLRHLLPWPTTLPLWPLHPLLRPTSSKRLCAGSLSTQGSPSSDAGPLWAPRHVRALVGRRGEYGEHALILDCSLPLGSRGLIQCIVLLWCPPRGKH
jgi:hypothetical protein